MHRCPKRLEHRLGCIIYAALENGDIDAVGEFTGTLLTYLGGTPTADPAKTYKALLAKLKGTDIVASKYGSALDQNAFYVTKGT